MKKAVPYGQFIGLRRINRDYNDFLSQAQDLMERLRARGYPEDTLTLAFHKAIKMERHMLIHQQRRKKRNDRSVFSFQYSPMSEKIKRATNSNWSILVQDNDLRDKAANPPIISFRRCRNELVSGNTPNRDNATWLSHCTPTGNHKCGQCSFCAQMIKGKHLTIGGTSFSVKDLIACRSKFVTYAIFCPCKRHYIGKTNRTLFTRFREH